jgi:hypothetical protein
MAYIGNTVQNQGFAPAIDYFSGNGVTVTFTLSRPVASVAQLIVAIDNVIQNPSTAFTVAGNSITFTSAPLSGTNNIWVEYTSLITTYQGISQDPTVIGDIRATGGYLAEGDFGNSFVDGAIVDYVTGRGRVTVGELDDITFYHGGTTARSEMMDLYYAGGAKIYGTTALTIPVGTTAQRPGTPASGMIRMNSTTGFPEWYSAATASWLNFNQGLPYSVDYLVVAGGGAGGTLGGGGAGGYISDSTTVSSGTAYPITVGAGGTGTTGSVSNGANGNNSSFGSIATAIAGGGGARAGDGVVGSAGGSGGGGGADSTPGAGGAGTSGQGNNGGTAGANGAGTAFAGGGGGGASAVGGNAGSSTGGNGGNGFNWQSLGQVYAGGGGGGAYLLGSSGTAGAGGTGGGGNGGRNGLNATSATANTGGGGGGNGFNSSGNLQGTAGSGGSGIVIIRYLGSQRGTGGTITSAGGYTYHTFTSSGSYSA